MWLEVARYLADSLILPFNLSDYALAMKDMAKTFTSNFKDDMNEKGIETGKLHMVQFMQIRHCSL